MRKFHIYIDESEIEGTIVLGAILVPDKHLHATDRSINNLRVNILREMQSYNYPILDPLKAEDDRFSRQKTERIRLANGGLPEIHAAELWSSDQVFWMDRDGTDSLLIRHRNWIKRSLALLEKFEIKYFRNVLRPDVQTSLNESESDVYESLKEHLTSDINRSKVKNLQRDPYVRLFFGMMQSIEGTSRREGWKYTIICDRGKKNEMFKAFETFDLLKRFGSWQNVISIDFQESHENNLIQLCDVVTYIDSKTDFLKDGHKDKSSAKSLRSKYVLKSRKRLEPLDDSITSDGFFLRPSHSYAELMAMLTEMALLHCGGQQKTLPERRRRLQSVIDQFPEIFQRNFHFRIR